MQDGGTFVQHIRPFRLMNRFPKACLNIKAKFLGTIILEVSNSR
jgi:hypothetical protein